MPSRLEVVLGILAADWARMIPDETIAEIRERMDIVELIGEYVRLSKSGASFKGLCPFHAEKTPSFYVHPQRRFFHCFGCQASGDVFSFLTQLEGISFPEAARRLASKTGVEIPEANAAESAERSRRKRREERLVDVMDAAAGFFAESLRTHRWASFARTMCEERGVSAEFIKRFRLGYAPHGWDGLVRFLQERGTSMEDAETMGLVAPRRGGGGHYDRFRHRLMFPIADHQGRIIAFSGRELPPPPGDDARETPKYINSPESPLYTKGSVLFGLHEGRVQTRREGYALICEGNFDLVKLHQAGFGNSVAPMGTALTAEQATLLRRFADRVVLLFDGDRAGRSAVRSAHPILAKAGLQCSVVGLPPGDDPDSFLTEHGEEALRERVSSAPNIVEYLIDQGAAESIGDPAKKAAAIESLGPVLRAVDNPVEVRLYVERVAQRFEVRDIDAVRRQLRRGLRQGQRRRRSPEKAPAEAPTPRTEKRTFNPIELELLGVFVDQPRLLDSAEAERFASVLTDPDLRAILQATSRMVGSCGEVEASALTAEFAGNPALSWLEGRLVQPSAGDEESARSVLLQSLPRLEARAREREALDLQKRAFEARRQGNDELADELTRQRLELLRQGVRP
ncbi:MAG: DNA primase [Myxococcota bacterium]